MQYLFSPEKNAQLREKRGVSFDEVIAAIENDQVLDIIEHPNTKKYPNQELIIINVKGYVYVVPFVTQENGDLFLKTIYPSRKAKKIYEIKKGDINEEND